MKKITALCAAIALCSGVASAQYLCTDPGTVLSYKSTHLAEKDSISVKCESTVASVTDNEGTTVVMLDDVEGVPGNDLMEVKSKSSYTYNAATGLTVNVMLTGEDYTNTIIDMLVEGARSQGQSVTDSDLAEIRRMITAKGTISVDLPAEPVEGTKIPNKTIKLSMGPQTMSMSLWEGKYLGFETVETPAGTFENCQKISYVMKMNSPEGTEKTYTTAWYAKGVGLVKETGADKKGNIKSLKVLQSIKK